MPLDRFRTYAVAGELFPTQRLGVRLGYSRWDGDRLRDQSYDVSTTWFFTRKIAVHFGLARVERDGTIVELSDADTFSVRFTGRL